jgi:hypothetical protein
MLFAVLLLCHSTGLTTQIRPLYQVLLGFSGELNIAPRWRWTALPAATRPRRLPLFPRRPLR